MIRFIAVSLALLAGAKIWTQEQIYRTATEDALLQAYRPKAIASCRTAYLPATTRPADRLLHQRIAAGFASPSAVHLEIGNRDLSVPIWQIDHAAWAMRYTTAYIVLEATTPAARCAYDMKLDKVHISVL